MAETLHQKGTKRNGRGLKRYEKDLAFLDGERPRFLNKPKTSKIRKRDKTVRDNALEAVEYLAALSEKLSPDQHGQIFNETTLKRLLESLFISYPKKWFTFKDRKNKTRYAEDHKGETIPDNRLFRLSMTAANMALSCAKESVDVGIFMRARATLKMFPTEDELNLLAYHFFETSDH